MSTGVDIAIGVMEGKVIAKWRTVVSEITFDPKNAYMIGRQLMMSAMEAHRGYKNGDDLSFIAEDLGGGKAVITDARREVLIGQVATIIKTFIDQKKTPGYIAMHAVDTVLADTAK